MSNVKDKVSSDSKEKTANVVTTDQDIHNSDFQTFELDPQEESEFTANDNQIDDNEDVDEARPRHI